MRKNTGIVIGILLVLAGVLTGCGRGKNEDGNTSVADAQNGNTVIAESEVKEYRVEFRELEPNIQNVLIADGQVYYSFLGDGNASSVYRLDPISGDISVAADTEELRKDSVFSSIYCFDLADDGRLGVVEGDATDFIFEVYNKDGKSSEKNVITDGFNKTDQVLIPRNLSVLGSGYAIAVDDIYFFEGDSLKDKGNIAGLNNVINVAYDGDENLYVCGLFGRGAGIKKYDLNTGKFTDAVGLDLDRITGISKGSDKGTVFVHTEGSLYLYDTKTEESKLVFDWNPLNIDGNDVVTVGCKEAVYYAVIKDDSAQFELAVISPKSDENEETADGPVELVIATCCKTDALGKAVKEYNRSHSDYHITIKVYDNPDDGHIVNTQEDVNNLMLDVLGSDPPDMIDLGCFWYRSPSVDDLVEKGYLEDLTPYVEKSETVNEEDYIECAFNSCKKDGFLAAIPDFFGFFDWMADESVFGHGPVSVKDIIELEKENPGSVLPEGGDEYLALIISLEYNLDFFVDTEKGKCIFDCDEFREIMEFARDYTGKSDAQLLHDNRNGGMIRFNYIDNVEGIQRAPKQYFYSNGFYCGVPTMDGRKRMVINMSNATAPAILKVSEHKDAAWDFIECLLGLNPNDGNGKYGFYGIPSKKEYLAEYIERLSEPDGPLAEADVTIGAGTSDEYVIKQHPLTKEEIADIYEMFDYVENPKWELDPVWGIVIEEAEAYFKDQKTLDEVIRIIQSRASIYLAERV